MWRLGLFLLIAAAAAILFLLRPTAVPNPNTNLPPTVTKKADATIPTPPDKKKESPPPATNTAQKKPLPFTREGVAAKIIEEVERVARPKSAAVALFSSENARMACVVVDAPDRYAVLDPNLSAQYLAILEAQGFHEPPQPMSMTMSRYASVAKAAMQFDEAKGDRTMVLVCPKSEWNRISLDQ